MERKKLNKKILFFERKVKPETVQKRKGTKKKKKKKKEVSGLVLKS